MARGCLAPISSALMHGAHVAPAIPDSDCSFSKCQMLASVAEALAQAPALSVGNESELETGLFFDSELLPTPKR